MPDPAGLFLLDQILHNAHRFIGIEIDGVLVQVVEMVDVEIIHAALLQLRLKNLGRVREVDLPAREAREGQPTVLGLHQHVTGEFAHKMIALPGINGKRLPRHQLALPLVIAIGGVEIVDAVLIGISDERDGLLLINRAPLTLRGEPHAAEPETGKFPFMEFEILHSYLRFQVDYSYFTTDRAVRVNGQVDDSRHAFL